MTKDNLERQYEEQQKKVIKYSKLYNLPFGRLLYEKKLINAKLDLQAIFRELRDETRKTNPEKFISSKGSNQS